MAVNGINVRGPQGPGKMPGQLGPNAQKLALKIVGRTTPKIPGNSVRITGRTGQPKMPNINSVRPGGF